MFPSRNGLPWPEEVAKRDTNSVTRVFDFIESSDPRWFSGDDTAAYKEVNQYTYLRDSPYLAADRERARFLFSIAAGEVLVDEDLRQVAHASSVYEGRQAIYLPSGRVMQVEVDVPEGASLDFGAIALAPFNKTAVCDGELSVFAGETLLKAYELSAEKSKFHWQDEKLDLPAGKQKLRFESKARCENGVRVTPENDSKIPDSAFAHLFLSSPRIFAPRPSSETAPLNVLYINLCTSRRDDFHTYGQARQSSPYIDELARTGVKFDNAHSNSNWSKGSQISALLGRYPSATGVRFFQGAVSRAERTLVNHLRWPSLPEIFRHAGYESQALVDNVFLADFIRVGIDLGFERFIDNARHLKNGVELTRDAVDFIEKNGEKPFFLYINIANPHHKYRPPYQYAVDLGLDGLVENFETHLHLGEILFSDDMVGRMIQALEKTGLRDRTLVVLHADHGEILEENRNLEVHHRGERAGQVAKFDGTLHRHGWTWFEAESRVPLILNLPGRLEPQVLSHPVTLVDVAPTILKLAGLEIPNTFQGLDLFDTNQPPSLLEGKQFDALVDGTSKYVHFHKGMDGWRHLDEPEFRHTPELFYDLLTDPNEEHYSEPAAMDSAKVESMRNALKAQRPALNMLNLLAFDLVLRAPLEGEIELKHPVATATLRDQGPNDHFEIDGSRIRFTLHPSEGRPILAWSGESLDEATFRFSTEGELLPGSVLRLGPHALPNWTAPKAAGVMSAKKQATTLGLSAGQSVATDSPSGVAPRIFWWTQRINNGGPDPFGAVDIDESVMEAMRDWGYAH